VSELALEIIIIFLLLVANGVFAMSEMAVVAARKIRLKRLADSGDTRAQTALKLAKSPNKFLATVQIGITLVGIMAGAFGGATIAESIASYLNVFSLLAPYSELIGVGVVVIFITYFSLIVGELVPKRLALNNPERIAAMMSPPMQLLCKMALPVVRLLELSTNIVIRVLGVKPSLEPAITLEEIKVLIEQGTESGIFEETEQDMIENVLRLDERPVAMCMTPRTKIVWLDIGERLEEIQRKVVESHHSRFPVVKDNLDNIIGIVRAKDLLVQSLAHQRLDLKVLLRPPLFIPESMSALDVLELFKRQGTHIALVTDEYGGILGMVTHNDILEDIVGNIPTAGEASAEPQAKQRDDGSWLVDGLLDIDALKEIFEIEQLPDEEDRGYHTVGGFIMSRLQGIPAVGQHFQWRNLRFEVVDMDGRRVDKVLIIPLS
jgi:putative hemolysin